MKGLFIFFFTISSIISFSQTGINTSWVWVNGDSTVDQAGSYGTLGVASTSNKPGARVDGCAWVDGNGNFWLFGGKGYASVGSNYLNDLWMYSISSNKWTWVSGSNIVNQPGIYGTQTIPSSLNTPGARWEAASWTDNSGNLWLFGGYGLSEGGGLGQLNDLWKFDQTISQWIWISGTKVTNTFPIYGTQGIASSSNMPGARTGTAKWKDNNGNFWIFGGSGPAIPTQTGSMNQLWKYNPITNQWTWMKGNNNLVVVNGIYGTQTVSNIINNPGSRDYAITWTDNNNNLWMMGGLGYSNSSSSRVQLGDLWKYNIVTNEWTWMKGDSTGNQTGVYGTQGIPSSLNTPGGRDDGGSWKDLNGDLWLFGGTSLYSSPSKIYNDLWKYNLTTNEWTWVKGDDILFPNGFFYGGNGIYGSLGIAANTNKLGSRGGGVHWTDNLNNFWLFGGYGFAASGGADLLNDLWKISGASLIPLSLLDFYGSVSNDKNILFWETSNEINSKNFLVERSYDGNNFIKLGSVEAAGNSSSTKKYKFIDEDFHNNISYYRLKMIDNDNKFTYSKVLALRHAVSQNEMNVFPNPASSFLFIQLKGQTGSGILQLTDILGRKLTEIKIQMIDNLSYSIDIASLTNGTYNIIIKTNSETFISKFMKTN